MRRIRIDHARKGSRVKHGGRRVKVKLSGVDLAASYDFEKVLALDDVFQRLEERDLGRRAWFACGSTPV